VAVEIALEDIDNVVRGRSATVVSFVHNDALLILLREVIAVETGITRLAGVWQIDVSQSPVRDLIYQSPVRLDPGARPQCLIGRNRDHRHLPRALHHRSLVDADG